MHYRMQGLVKWFSAEKGYGFILPEVGEQEVFVHYSAIQTEGYKTLEKGARVEFELFDGPKGQQARAVSLVSA
jgi:cold shock protein